MNRKVFMMPIDKIRPDPNQPRKVFDPDDIAATAFTIEAQGIINPIEVDENNIIVTGEIRWKAAKLAGLKEVPCILWKDGTHKRFERQVVENLHHHQLTDQEREDAIVKLWESGEYPTQRQLGKAVGLSESRISSIIEANKFRKKMQISPGEVSTKVVADTVGLEDHQRVKILEKVSEGKIRATDVQEVKKIAQVSDELLDSTLEGKVSVERAIEARETLQDLKTAVGLTKTQEERFVENIEKDEHILRQYKTDVLRKVKQVMTTKPSERPTIQEPIGRESPVRKIIAVKDEVLDNFMAYLGHCDANERSWALRVLKEIKEEIDRLIEMIENV